MKLANIKTLRKRFHLNQKDLASKAGVSQSLIAKIEAGKVEPTYSKAQQIFQALEELRDGREIKAISLMNTKVCFVNPDDSVKNAVLLMKKKGISQIPVQDKESVKGVVTESFILEKMTTQGVDVSALKVKDVMDEAPPIVPPTTGFTALSHILKEQSIVLVAQKGEVRGIISKTDLLNVEI